MPFDDRELQRYFNEVNSSIASLSAAMHGLISQLKASQGDEAVDLAMKKALDIASKARPFDSGRPNSAQIKAFFDEAKKL